MTANLAAAIFLLVGLGMSFFGYRLIRKAQASAEWPTANGTIKSSTVDVERERERDSEGDIHYETKYIPNIVYQYQVEGMDYIGERVSFGGTSSSNQARAYKLTHQYPEGAEVTVYFNPEDPHDAVLQPGTTWTTYVVLVMGVVFTLTGALIFFAV